MCPSSCVNPAGASTNLTSRINRMTTHTHVKNGKRGACEQKAATVLPNRTAAA